MPPTFVVERFGWGAPDRLEVAGTFSGIGAESPAGAVLTVVGDDGPHRLPAIDQEAAAPPTDGARWAAAFAWQEAPVAFDRARLELGASIAIDLPAPDTAAEGDPLAVEVLDAGDDEPPLLEQAEQLEEARATARQAEEALLRAQAGLAAAEAAQQAQTEIDDLRQQLAGLESARSQRDAALAQLASARSELEALRSELDAMRGALATARADAQDLVDRLSEHVTGRR